MAETILLTGAAGLIGRALHRRLVDRGDTVIAIDRIGGDDILACDLTEVHRLHELGAGATAVLHCGAISGPMVARDNPHRIVQSNIVGTANILELARVRRMRRVVFLSSVSAYGNTPRCRSGAGECGAFAVQRLRREQSGRRGAGQRISSPARAGCGQPAARMGLRSGPHHRLRHPRHDRMPRRGSRAFSLRPPISSASMCMSTTSPTRPARAGCRAGSAPIPSRAAAI